MSRRNRRAPGAIKEIESLQGTHNQDGRAAGVLRIGGIQGRNPQLPQRWRVETLQVFRLSIGRSPLRRPLGDDQSPPPKPLRARHTARLPGLGQVISSGWEISDTWLAFTSMVSVRPGQPRHCQETTVGSTRPRCVLKMESGLAEGPKHFKQTPLEQGGPTSQRTSRRARLKQLDNAHRSAIP